MMSRPQAHDASSIKNWPESYGQDDVLELRKAGNPLFARGAFGEISMALYRDPQTNHLRLVGVKTLLKSTVVSFAIDDDGEWQASEQKLCPNVSNELQALHTLRPHANIVTLLAVYTHHGGAFSATNLSLAFEYCPTDLYLTMEWRRRTVPSLLSFNTIQTIASDLFAALHFCHGHGILHSDIKSANLLVASTGVIKLCDFGLARTVSTRDPNHVPKEDGLCTLAYRPPEVLLGGQYSHSSADIYSAGVVIAELVLGRTLFPGVNNLDQLGRVFACLGTPTNTHWPEAHDLPHAKLEFRHHEPLHVTDYMPRTLECQPLADFLQHCLELDPKRRLSSADAVHHGCMEPQGLASRDVLKLDLIPRDLDEPFLMSLGEDRTVAVGQALALATTRRTFLKKLDVWKYTSGGK